MNGRNVLGEILRVHNKQRQIGLFDLSDIPVSKWTRIKFANQLVESKDLGPNLNDKLFQNVYYVIL